MADETPLPGGVVHELPKDLAETLRLHPDALATWMDITPLARNEWICWIDSAKRQETRRKRIDWGCSSLTEGKRRPCCWPGCPHREKVPAQTTPNSS
ncbi:MAG TPA: YdeI/OmpD-associated family protein [Sphingomicrobium sp.]|nr:YdeI/OmpD-associated family protein [Sphingomicrobium sp.]